MDTVTDLPQMLGSERGAYAYDYITECNQYGVLDLPLTVEAVKWLWEQMTQYRTLFSDTTLGDLDNYVNLVTLPNSRWYRVVRKSDDATVGVLYLTDIQPALSAVAHVMFFDRQFSDKVAVVREHLRLLVQEMHLHRVTAIVPKIYHATIRFAGKLGFVQEGVFRQSVLIGGKYIDEVLLGALASEV